MVCKARRVVYVCLIKDGLPLVSLAFRTIGWTTGFTADQYSSVFAGSARCLYLRRTRTWGALRAKETMGPHMIVPPYDLGESIRLFVRARMQYFMASVKEYHLASKIKSPTKIFYLKNPLQRSKSIFENIFAQIGKVHQSGCFLTEAMMYACTFLLVIYY